MFWMILACFKAQIIKRRRATGISAINPRVSVKNPGVRRSAPQMSSTSPSNISMVGILPLFKLP